MKELSTERAIEALYTIRAYYASLTAGYPKGKDRRGIGDVMCSEIANSCFMAIKALEQTEPGTPEAPQKVIIHNAVDVFSIQTELLAIRETLTEIKKAVKGET